MGLIWEAMEGQGCHGVEEVGLDIGNGGVGRSVGVSGIKPVRTRRHKITTNSSRVKHRVGR
jgi:putative transposase